MYHAAVNGPEPSSEERACRVDAVLMLLGAPLLITVWRYHGAPAHFPAGALGLAEVPLREFHAVIWHFGSFFVLFFAAPALFMRLRMKRPWSLEGFGAGDHRFGLKACALALPLAVLPAALAGSWMPDVRQEYPLLRLLHARRDLVVPYEIAYVTLYYTSWEFFFRGFLLFPFRDAFGGGAAVAIQTAFSCLAHIGKPEGEILGSIPAGVLLGMLALRTGSFWYGFVLHAALGVLTDLFVLAGT